MVVKLNKKSTYISAIFFLFSFFFVSPVISPQVNGYAVYINWFIPFIDYYFICYLLKKAKKIKRPVLYALLLFVGMAVLRGKLVSAFKIATIIYSVIYLQYAYMAVGFRQMYTAFNLNILLAVVQFVVYLKNPALAYLIGPENIASLIWGSENILGNTNFYPIFFNIPRVCGLSREAGFFASLLSSVVIVYLFDNKVKKNKVQIILFFIAYFISFSKMSILLPLILIILKFRKIINEIPLGTGFAIIWLLLGLVSVYLNKTGFYAPYHESLSHRLYGYGIVFNNLSVKEMLIGNINGVLQLNNEAIKNYPIYSYLMIRGLDTFCGYPQLIISFGYIGLIVFLFALYLSSGKTSGLFVLIFATFSVDLTTATSFVVLTYWFIIYGIKQFSINKNRKIFYLSCKVNQERI